MDYRSLLGMDGDAPQLPFQTPDDPVTAEDAATALQGGRKPAATKAPPKGSIEEAIMASLNPSAAPPAKAATPVKKAPKPAAVAAPKAPQGPSATELARAAQGGVGGAANQSEPIDVFMRGVPWTTTEGNAKQEADATTREAQILSDPNMATLNRRANELQMDALKAQSAGIGTNLSMLKAMAERPPQLDLSPLVALADSTTGSKLSAAYRKPATPQEYMEDLLKNRNSVLTQQNQFSKDQIDLIKAQISGYTQNKLLDQLAGKVTKTDVPPRQIFDPANNQFAQMAQKGMSDYNTSLHLYADIWEALQGNGIMQKAVGAKLARSFEGARPAMAMVNVDSAGDPAWPDQLQQFLNKAENGTLTSKNVSEYKELLRTVINRTNAGAKNKLAGLRQVGATSYHQPAENINAATSQSFTLPNAFTPPPKPDIDAIIGGVLGGKK